jgi:Protein of unknown function (DUF2924)
MGLPGTKLLRQFQGEMHEVLVGDKGFEYRGKWYESLSEIARQITGTRWSGPLFFGLKQSRIPALPRVCRRSSKSRERSDLT